MDRTFLLVLGAPRSGTTLLTAMIGRHDEVAMLNEDFGRAARDLISKQVVGNKLCVPNQIEMSRRGGRWWRKLQRRGFLQYQPESDLSIEDYLTWEPLRLVAIVRDGDAVISSIMRRGEKSYKLAAYRWSRGIEIIHELTERCPDSLFLLSFEQLVSEPERVMRALADHLELSFQEKMLEGYAHTPLYSNRKVDASRAERQKEENIDFGLEREFPDVFEKYQYLKEVCSESLGSRSIKDASI